MYLGNKYALPLNGVGHKPRLDLSFMQADFGPVNVFQPGMTPASRVLFLRNNDTLPVSVEPQWANTEEWQVGEGGVREGPLWSGR